MATLPQPATAPGGKATGFNDLFKQDQPFLRRSRFLAVAISALLFLFAYTNLWRFYAEIPPDYRAWHERELLLPQNYPDLPYPQGRTGYYVRVSNHVSGASRVFQLTSSCRLTGPAGLGWGNVMQEMIMNAHMAFKSGRAFSFYNYTWDPSTPHHYTRFGDNWTPSRIPISAFVSGPVAGDPFPAPHKTLPAISSEFFDEVCEYPAQIDIDLYVGDVGVLSAKSLVDYYVGLIRDIPDHCVEFVSHVSKEIFDYTLFEDGPRLLDIWDELIASPILTNWKWSELVMSVMEDNHALVHPSLAPGSPADRPLPGLLALHVRQGDYAEHCQYLLRRRTPFHGFNQHPSFPDQFTPPQGPGTDGAAIDFYSKHCIPEMDHMVERVLSVRAQHANWTGRALDSMYILTNAKREWLDEFKTRLMRRAHWDAIVTSRDLTLTSEQKFVSQASDMMLASRAEVFVGNGWSTLTSNANLLRAAAHRAPETTRFW